MEQKDNQALITQDNIRQLTSLSEEERKRSEAFRRFKKEMEEIFGDGKCDKCGQPVPLNNNAGVFDFINHVGHWTQLFNLSRHLESVTDERGVVICEGSPSRWAAIHGLPDERPEYKDNKPDLTAEQIWELMQKLVEE